MTEATQAAVVDVNLDGAIAKYVELRDAVARHEADFKAKTAPMQAAMKTIEGYFMNLVNKTGQTTFGGPSGTAFRDTKTGCNVKDWETFLPWMKANDAFQLLNKAVNKTAVKEYIDAHDTPPPGIEWVAIYDIKIRRA